MKWRLWRPDVEPTCEPDDKALDEAHRALEDQIALWPEIRETREHMKRREDRLAQAVAEVMRSKR